MSNWNKQDLETEYTYYTGTIFKGHAAELLDETRHIYDDLFEICNELEEYVKIKFNGDTNEFIKNVKRCADYYYLAPLLKLMLLEER